MSLKVCIDFSIILQSKKLDREKWRVPHNNEKWSPRYETA